MTDAQMRADVEALMARLTQTEQALLGTRWPISAGPKTAPLMDFRAIGKDSLVARVVIPVYGIRGICELGSDRREPSTQFICNSWNTRLRGSESSAVSCPGAVLHRKRPGDSDERGSQQQS